MAQEIQLLAVPAHVAHVAPHTSPEVQVVGDAVVAAPAYPTAQAVQLVIVVLHVRQELSHIQTPGELGVPVPTNPDAQAVQLVSVF